MDKYLAMLRAKNLFTPSDKSFGMPAIDSSSVAQMLSNAHQTATSLKNDDMFRQKQLMEFEHSLRNRIPNQAASNADITRGPNAIKRNITQFAPPTQMQQQFRQDDLQGKQRTHQTGLQNSENTARLNQAITENRMRSEAEMAQLGAQINARREEGGAERTSRENIAAREAAARTAELEARRLESGADRQYRREDATADRAARSADVATRGAQEMAQIAARPESAALKIAEQNQRVQDFMIQNPGLENNIKFDPNSKTWQVNYQGMDPIMREKVKSLAGGSRPAGPTAPRTLTKGQRGKNSKGEMATYDGTKWVKD